MLTTVRRAAMGAELVVTTDASAITTDVAIAAVACLERRWSRFLSDSELSWLNAANGPVVVRPSTARVIDVALAGSRLTRGWFDPTRGADIRAAGYRRTLSAGWAPTSECPARDWGERGYGPISVDTESGLVHIPDGIEIDLGGIAKGWAADLAVALLRENRATHAGVSIGGDVRVCSDTRAVVEIAAPDGSDADPALLGLRDGGVAVSGPTKRRAADGRHHLIDPFTGAPAQRPRVAAVVAATAAGAEMIATAAAIAPLADAIDIVESFGATAWLTELDGTVTTLGEPDRFVLDAGWLAEPARQEWARREWTA